MECPNCQFENPAAARFCQNCGHSLEQTCPNCGTVNPVSAKFCMECGTRLLIEENKSPGPDPVPVAETSERETASERRVVTILFCDIKGSTNLAEQVDPEMWTEVMDGAFEYLVGAVSRYDGTVGRLMGDGILAFFGAPVAHEDDPLRAIRAGLDMLQDLKPYQEEARNRLKAAGVQVGVDDFEVRVGINTGLVVVGAVGTSSGSEYTAMGDAANMAARMEQSAQPGTVQISHDTYKLVAPFIESKTLGEIAVKGKRDPIKVYRVFDLIQTPGVGRGLAGRMATLTGRDRELTQLKWALADVIDGNGGIVCLMGEAGIGKSRLISELRSDKEADNCRWLMASSLSFEQGQPYGLLRRLVRNLAGVAAGETFPAIRTKLVPLLAEIEQEGQNEIDQVLQALFGAVGPGSQAAVDGEKLQSMLTGAMRSLWHTYAAGNPLVIVLEDLHWTDSASVETIKQLLPLTSEFPLLLLCAFRLHQQAPVWQLKLLAEDKFATHFTGLTLGPLNQQYSQALASSLMEMAEIPGSIQHLVLDRSEGNPFFIEETVRELIESGAIGRDLNGQWQIVGDIDHLSVPENLESLLVARQDRLDEATRRVLQISSVIGRSFYYRVLALVIGDNQRLDELLQRLLDVDLIQVAARKPELEYMFRHALTQEAAYNTILLKDRRRYHRRIGEVMESIFSDALEEQAPLLARHFAQADELKKALTYYSLAAENASRLYTNREALNLYNRAVEIAAQLGMEAANRASLRLGRGRIYERVGDFEKALADFEGALTEAQVAADQQLVWRLLVESGKLWTARDYDKAGSYFRRALELSRSIGQPALLAESLNRIGNLYLNQGQPALAVASHREALAIFEREEDRNGLAATYDLLGMNNLIAGDVQKAVENYRQSFARFYELDDYRGMIAGQSILIQAPGSYLLTTQVPVGDLIDPEVHGREPLELARKIGWQAGEAFILQVFATQYCLEGYFDKAFKAAEESIRLATEIDHLQWMAGANLSLGVIYLTLLTPERARSYFEAGRDLAHRTSSHFWLYNLSGYLAQAYIDLGQFSAAKACLDQILPAEKHAETVGERQSWLSRAILALATDDPDQALEIIDWLIATAANLTAGKVITLLWLFKGEVLITLNQAEAAETILLEGLANCLNRGERAFLWRYYASLAQLYQRNGRDQEAGEQEQLGIDEIGNLAGSIPEATLKTQFIEQATERIRLKVQG